MELNNYYCLTHPHPLVKNQNNGHWFCDISTQFNSCISGSSYLNVKTGGFRFRCSKATCNYAICPSCYDYYKCSEAEMPKLKSPFLALVHPHELTENFAKNGWSCDGRKLKETTEFTSVHVEGLNKIRYSCRKCDYDLCETCFLSHCDTRLNLDKVLLFRIENTKGSKGAEFVRSKTVQLVAQEDEESIDALKEEIKCLRIENEDLKKELTAIKHLVAEISEELNEFKNSLDSEIKSILLKNVGNAFSTLSNFSLDRLSDIMTFIPGVGQIMSACRFVYGLISDPMKAYYNKKKSDSIKKTLTKLDNLCQKLNSLK